MDANATDFTKNDTFDTWTSSGDISSTSDFMMPVEETIGQKRAYQGQRYAGPPAKRPAPSIRLGAGYKWNLQALAHAASAVENGGKSPVSALNELGVRVQYHVLRQGGPAHCPSFTVAVQVADMTFEGWGHSKREARVSAARACLAALLARVGRVPPAPAAHAAPQDFTADDARYTPSDFQCLEVQAKPAEPEPKAPETPPAPAAPSAGAALFGAHGASAHKSPINSLYERCPGLTFLCTFGDGSPLSQPQAPVQLSHSMRFKVVCQIKDQTFEGYGSSKKLAKLAAARAALAVLEQGSAPAARAPPGCLPQPLADRVGKLVNEKFHDLMKGDLVHSKRKVLAGIVMTTNYDLDSAKVIAVTTGTKCVSGEHMSVRGRAVNDCHAEVAARRCLQRHLYAQLLMYAEAEDPRAPLPASDLEPLPAGGYQLKPDRRLHLYVSTAPCGDGRIFSPHEQPDPAPDRHPNRLARGQLRTKIESGEGTIPVKNCTNVIQTWDGVMQGERLLTMSCSDKVCRWCVVGLQGALLARLLRPVYLHSLVLGSLLHPHHMYRAICGRIEGHLQSLPPPYRLQRPLLARAASTEARTPARAPSFSVCWARTAQVSQLCGRIEGRLRSLPPPYRLQRPLLARAASTEARTPARAPSFSVCWARTAQVSQLCGRIEGRLRSLPPPYRLQRPLLARAASTEARTPARAPSFSVCWARTAQVSQLCGRIEGRLRSLPPPYRLQRPLLARAASTEARTPARAPSFSVCWARTAQVSQLCGRIEGRLRSLPPPYRLQRPLLARAASTEARTPARAPSFSVCWARTAQVSQLCGRIEGRLRSLPPPYRLQRPLLARAASTEARTPARAPSFSVCWARTAQVSQLCGRIEGRLRSLPPPYRLQRPLLARAASTEARTEARTPARAPSFSVCWARTAQVSQLCGRIEGRLRSLPPPYRLQRPLLARAASTEARTPARAPSFSVCWARTAQVSQLCGRIEGRLRSLPPPYRLQRPLLARAASTEARTPARAPSFSVCWARTAQLPEVINATTGKLESGQPSLLCKQTMFARWRHLVARLPLPPHVPAHLQEPGTEPAPLPDNLDSLLYNEAKQLCPAYQAAKDRLTEAFDKAKLGHWIKKPIEQDQFVCEIVGASPAHLFA